KNLSNHVGCDVIAETADGQRLVGVLAAGSMRGRYTIRSFDPRQPEKANLAISWAAPIQVIVRDV
ncbi:MAG: hypothetical protein ACOYJ6_20730, partial [Caulobacterales bacterium]